MKEVCERTGLTDRAVRLYIDNGLLNPMEEKNYTGRKSIHFSEDDVAVLEVIATLRKADFSIFDIREMQSSPERVHVIIDEHKKRLAADIENKKSILQSLEKIDCGQPMEYTKLAELIRQPASEKIVPKEDSVVKFKDFQQIIKNRIFSVIAFALLLVETVYLIPMCIKTAFADIFVWAGGGIALEYTFSAERLFENIQILGVGILMIVSLVLLFVHIVRGEKWLLATGGALCILSVTMMLFLPGDIRKALFDFEFMNYRFSFMWHIFYANTAEFDYFIKSIKFIPLLAAAVLSGIGVLRQKNIPPEEMQ